LDRFDFFPSFFNLFKIRAAYGETGQLPGTRDAIRLLWEATGSPYGTGARLDDIGNNEIQPERIKEFEVGFDTEFFNSYSLEVTYFRQEASNSIIPFVNAPSTGLSLSTVPTNIGKVKGWGIETLFSGRPIQTSVFQLDFTLVNSFQDNEVTDLGGAPPIYAADRGFNVIKEGLSQWAFHHYRLLGAKFKADGTYDGPSYSDEKEYLGTPIPPYTGSLSLNITLFKNLSVYAMTEWATGHSVLNYTQRQAIRNGNGAEIRELGDLIGIDPLTNNVWDPFPDRAPLTPGTPEYIAAANKLAKLTRTSRSYGGYIEPADFLRLREVSVSYNLMDMSPVCW
jgi:TonB-dependent starch-binding outer membrane protein SusC